MLDPSVAVRSGEEMADGTGARAARDEGGRTGISSSSTLSMIEIIDSVEEHT